MQILYLCLGLWHRLYLIIVLSALWMFCGSINWNTVLAFHGITKSWALHRVFLNDTSVFSQCVIKWLSFQKNISINSAVKRISFPRRTVFKKGPWHIEWLRVGTKRIWHTEWRWEKIINVFGRKNKFVLLSCALIKEKMHTNNIHKIYWLCQYLKLLSSQSCKYSSN